MKREKEYKMNKREKDILFILQKEGFINQRNLSEVCKSSLGAVNRALKNLIQNGYLNENIDLTEKAYELFREKSPQNAIILAAGFGMRMVPINTEIPKGLLNVYGEILIERIIRQLHEANIYEIYIVVGFMKEKYEYLIDKYGIEMIVNPEYSKKNNLYSLYLAQKHISNTYIIPCDIWCKNNPFNSHELYSWYMVGNTQDNGSSVCVNRKQELVTVPDNTLGNTMIGISYLEREKAKIVCEKINQLSKEPLYNNAFWEEALYQGNKMIVFAKLISSMDIAEINTYEQLRELDEDSNHLNTEAMNVIEEVFQVKNTDVYNINVLKKGMTNRSFLFSIGDKRYIMRIPGEGTDNLINRVQEATIYTVISGRNICDAVAYINPKNGYKITEYLEGARVCNPLNEDDVKKCMDKLRSFHRMQIKVDHEFDVFGQLEFYEQLWKGADSVYRDYTETKKHVLELKKYIHTYTESKVLCHIDAVPDNFLFFTNTDGKEEIRLIDWEYAGMQDPHIDIAMFSIYALYNKEQIDNLIDIYFEGKCDRKIRIKIYCYVAVCGLLWSNWCEYKRSLGVEFGEYSLRQYRYAKDYYRIVQEELCKDDICI